MRIRSARRGALRLILAAWMLLTTAPRLFAADTTAPTTPAVTDDGTYTTSATQLHAVWTSSDPESGIAQYQYLIRQDSTSGTILVNWTSTGTIASVTKTGLSLVSGKTYYIQVKAKNGAALWSAIGSSNGIKVDTTAPGAPGQPKEGSSTDLDYDSDGSYTIYWTAATDAESGIAAYHLQEMSDVPGTSWTTLTSTTTATSFAVSGRLDIRRYSYHVRAKNRAGLWGAWSVISDGILIDKTAPSAVTVTDDGATTTSTTQLHAVWTASSDPQSGIASYEYLIRQDSTAGTILVNWTSTGTTTSVTKTGLSLVTGKTYFVGVRAKNGAGLYSTAAYSNGILVQTGDTTPPTGTVSINAGAGYTKTTAVTLTLSATDNAGTVAQMQCSNDNVTYAAAEAYATSKNWTLTSGDGTKIVYAKFKDAAGNWSAAVSDTIVLDSTPPVLTFTSPGDQAVLGPQ